MTDDQIPIGYVRTEHGQSRPRVLEDCLECGNPLALTPSASSWADPAPETVYCRCGETYQLVLANRRRMDCPNCNEFVQKHHNYCHYCGKSLQEDDNE